MANSIEDILSIGDLKDKFSKLKECKSNVLSHFENITSKIEKLNQIYEELIRSNKQTLFLIGLDTFHFQKQLLNIEYGSLHTHHNMISNRIYSDYYKLHKIIKKYVAENIEETKIVDMLNIFANYPVYDSLNVHKIYSFEYTSGLYNDIVDLLVAMNEYCNNQKILLKNYKVKQNYGLNINNFVFAFENKINDQIGKIDLFTKYMHYFVEIHIKYYSKFLTKIRLMYSQINHDIKFDDSSKATNDLLISDLKNSVDGDSQIINQISKQISIMETNYSTPRKKDVSLNLYIPEEEIVINNIEKHEPNIPIDNISEYSSSKNESIYSQEHSIYIEQDQPTATIPKPKRKYTRKPKK
jgi:hypothetical protein